MKPPKRLTDVERRATQEKADELRQLLKTKHGKISAGLALGIKLVRLQDDSKMLGDLKKIIRLVKQLPEK